ncbi:hypothetical protein [Deinococcus hopiensis]|uniref:hypothetical protein n=1 Tax=Deinococcus hopiensis TaxID=309885 RepID=UPI001FE60C06|nr:hypothetical protein [Deinococcus hopiensis]
MLAGTATASHLHVSASLVAVAAGLPIGSLAGRLPAALSCCWEFGGFWRLADELLRIFLFALLARKGVAVPVRASPLPLGLLTVPPPPLICALSVQVPVRLLRRHNFSPYTRRLMVWGGLRCGGPSAWRWPFTVPTGAERDLLLAMTHLVVFSIAVQGPTVGRLAERAGQATEA